MSRTSSGPVSSRKPPVDPRKTPAADLSLNSQWGGLHQVNAKQVLFVASPPVAVGVEKEIHQRAFRLQSLRGGEQQGPMKRAHVKRRSSEESSLEAERRIRGGEQTHATKRVHLGGARPLTAVSVVSLAQGSRLKRDDRQG
jgi:hypothetical protein